QHQGARLFSERDGSVWMPACEGFAFSVPAVYGQSPQYVGIIRGRVHSPEKAVETFAKCVSGGLQKARRRGQLSHALYVRLGAPNEPAEILGFDTWASLDGLKEHYSDPAEMSGFGGVFAGPPAPSVWEHASGFSEW